MRASCGEGEEDSSCVAGVPGSAARPARNLTDQVDGFLWGTRFLIHDRDPFHLAASGVYNFTSSTRRFLARPSSAWLSAIGFASPKPWVSSRSAFTPCLDTSQAFTA